jgi:hypothetical protein
MRRVIATFVAVGATAFLSACGSSSSGGTAPFESLPTYTPPSPAPAATHTPHFCDNTPKEIAFVRADHQAHPKYKDWELCYDLHHAVRFCQHRPHGMAPNLLDVLIENVGDYDLAIQRMCPRLKPYLQRANFGFPEGDEKVGGTFNQRGYHAVITPGTYETTRTGISECYWERTTSGGGTIANDFIDYAPGHVVVTIYSSDGGFTSNGCGDWVRVS